MGDGYVYVVGRGEPGDPVKIGWSDNPERRLGEFQVGAPWKLQLLDTHRGPDALEKFLHREFGTQRMHGEWFLIDEPVKRVADKVRTWDGKVATGRRRARSCSFDRILPLLAKGAGVTGDDFRVFAYCAIKTREEGSVTAQEISEYLGLTPQATRRIAKKLADGEVFQVVGQIGRTIKYRVDPRMFD